MKKTLIAILPSFRLLAIGLLAVGLAASIALANIGWVLLSVLLIMEYGVGIKKFHYQPSPLDMPIAAWIGVFIVTSCLSIAPLHSFQLWNSELLAIVFYVCWYGINSQEADRALRIFTVATGIVSLFGLIQYMIGIDRNFLGVLTNIPEWAATVLPPALIEELALKQGRIIASRSHPLTFAECALFGFIFSLAFLIITRSIKKKIFWFINSLIILGAILFSFSRGPWLGLLAGAPVLLLVKKKHVIRVRYIAIALIGIALFMFLNPGLRSRILSLDVSSHESTMTRIGLWKTGFRIMRDYPITGIGPRSLKQVYRLYQSPEIPDKRIWSELHNQYIHIGAERGLLGLGIYLWLLATIGCMFFFAWKQNVFSLQGHIAAAGLACFVAFIVVSLTENAFFDSEVALLLWFILGTAVRHET
ncbi:MAG: hypothetical protein GF384_06885 [Elusimicrobia bacterium]|nr:hypothetical protein [Elusimicrobiota bacterium]MBD3412423.1 hypothetical protein [Elusimicrobiota bacterium]